MLNLRELAAAVRYEGGVSRRLWLAYTAALAALPGVAGRALAADKKENFPANPFTLGVASGDPDATSVVLWTRLAPKPNQPDGGLKPEPIRVTVELSDDESMKRILASGHGTASPQFGHSVHLEVTGLKPDRWYWYRFTAGDATSPVGRTRTLPEPGARAKQLSLAFASCQNFEAGHYTAYQQMARDDVDLVFFLGDYIYESAPRDNMVRRHTGPGHKLRTLDDYRQRYLQYRQDALLRGMHARCPWFLTWDDHEVENNYAGAISESKVTAADFLQRRAAAYQAYYEMMPLRAAAVPHGPDMLLYRQAAYGQLANFFVLDTRQYRTNQPNGGGAKPLNEAALKSTNTLLGKKQRAWLNDGLTGSPCTWNVLAQQVMLALVERAEGYAMDQWPGAAHERMDLLKFMADHRVANPVVLSGDIHSNWVNNLRVDDRQQRSPLVATEFVGTSITSGGNEPVETPAMEKMRSRNPFVKFHNCARGYVRCIITPKQWRSEYVAVADVTKVNSPVRTQAAFVVEAGKPGAEKA